jgi:hypothetical protein
MSKKKEDNGAEEIKKEDVKSEEVKEAERKIPGLEFLFEEETEDGRTILINHQDFNGNSLINLTIYRTTMCLDEGDFYALTKACNVAAKKLLHLDLDAKNE